MDLGRKWFSIGDELMESQTLSHGTTSAWDIESDYIEKLYLLSSTYINFLVIFVLVFLFYKNSPTLLLERPLYFGGN